MSSRVSGRIEGETLVRNIYDKLLQAQHVIVVKQLVYVSSERGVNAIIRVSSASTDYNVNILYAYVLSIVDGVMRQVSPKKHKAIVYISGDNVTIDIRYREV